MKSLDRYVFLLGDTHRDTKWIAQTCEIARLFGCKRILQLGDFGITNGARGERFLDRCQKAAERNNLVLHAFGGNHDDCDVVAKFEKNRDGDGLVTLRPNVRWIPRSARWEWSGWRFGAIGGAFTTSSHERTPGLDWWPEAEQPTPLDVLRLGDAPLDVFVSHEAPLTGEPTPKHPLHPSAVQGSLDSRIIIRQAIGLTRPKLAVHGHWHIRHSSEIVLYPDHSVAIEGLADNKSRNGEAWALLDLETLEVTNHSPSSQQAAA